MSMIVEIEDLATMLNVNLNEEPDLYPLLKQMVILPTGWLYNEREEMFVDSSTNHRQSDHPAQNILLQIIDSKRAELKEGPSPNQLEGGGGSLVNRRASWLEVEQPPEVMLFYTWFNEGSTTRSTLIRREVKLEYHYESKCFHVHIQGCDQIYQLSHILNKFGHPLDHHDLYVGAKIDVLGKVTTLMQANLITSQYIEKQARYLNKLTDSISNEMRKYSLKAPGSSVVANPVVFRSSANPASYNLRKMMKTLEELYSEFENLRPGAAAECWSKVAFKIGRMTLKQSASQVKTSTN